MELPELAASGPEAASSRPEPDSQELGAHWLVLGAFALGLGAVPVSPGASSGSLWVENLCQNHQNSKVILVDRIPLPTEDKPKAA